MTVKELKTRNDSQAQLAALKAALRTSQKEQQKLLERIGATELFFDRVAACVSASDPYPRRPVPKSGSATRASVVLKLSDWHIGEVIKANQTEGFGRYNLAVAKERMLTIVDDIVKWVDLQRRGCAIDTCNVFCEGDFVSGNLHEELQTTNEFPLPMQAEAAGMLLGEVFLILASNFKRVIAWEINADNHGRLSKKPQFKDRGSNNMTLLVNSIANAKVARCSNFVANRTDAIKLLADVEGYKFLIEHGNDSKSWMGIPFYGIRNMFGREAIRRMTHPAKSFHYISSAHWHVPCVIEDRIFINGCFPSGALVTLGDGTRKPIELIQVGDHVLSKGGEINPVTELFKRKHFGTITALRLNGRYNEIRCTDNHKLWAIKRNRMVTLDCDTFHRANPSVCKPQWIPAEMLSDGDYVHVPYPKFTEVDWDLDWCRFIGLYLAEGSASGAKGKLHHIDFTFHEKEGEYAKFVETICIKKWGRATRKLRMRSGQHGGHKTWTVTCNSSEAAETMVRLCGKGAHFKRLNSELMGLSRKCHAAILGGWVQGDGYMSTRCVKAHGRMMSSASVSKDLADQMFLLSLRAGAIPSLLRLGAGGPKRKSDCYTLRWGGSHAEVVSKLTGEKFNGVARIDNTGSLWIGDDAFIPVKVVGSEHFDGDVFNLTVENDHSYTVGGVGVANSLSGTTEFDHAVGRHAEPAQCAFLVGPKHGYFNWTAFRGQV